MRGRPLAKSLNRYGNALPRVIWRTTACRSSKSPGCLAIRKSRRSITPTKGGPEQRQTRHRDKATTLTQPDVHGYKLFGRADSGLAGGVMRHYFRDAGAFMRFGDHLDPRRKVRRAARSISGERRREEGRLSDLLQPFGFR